MSNYHKTISDSLDIENKLVIPDNKSSKETSSDLVPVDDDKNQLTLFSNDVKNSNKDVNDIEIIDEETSVKDAKKDYEMVRGRLHQLAETGHQALEGILAVAEESEHPRAYEVVAQLIKTLAENSKQLMELHHDTQDLEDKKNAKRRKNNDKKNESDQESKSVTNNNAIFLGSTAELQKLIESQQK